MVTRWIRKIKNGRPNPGKNCPAIVKVLIPHEATKFSCKCLFSFQCVDDSNLENLSIFDKMMTNSRMVTVFRCN